MRAMAFGLLFLMSVPNSVSAQKLITPKSWAEVFEPVGSKRQPAPYDSLSTNQYGRCSVAPKPDSLLLLTRPRGRAQIATVWWPASGQTVFDGLPITMPLAGDSITVRLVDTWCQVGRHLVVERNNVYALVPASEAIASTWVRVPGIRGEDGQLIEWSTGVGTAYVPRQSAKQLRVARAAAESAAGGDSLRRADEVVQRREAEMRRLFAERAEADSLRREEAKARERRAVDIALKEDSQRVATIRKKNWPAKFARLVRKGDVAVGMNEEMVRLAWGEPEDINTTETASGTSEQWVYFFGHRYVYFENGTVTAIQQL